MTARTRTATALLVVAALTASAAPAQAQTAPAPRSTDRVCALVPPTYQPFDDLGTTPYEREIECLAFAGIALGGPGELSASSFGPTLPVRRDAMAGFIARTLDVARAHETQPNRVRECPPYDGKPAFSDIAGNVHEGSISRINRCAFVTQGVGDNRYDPAGVVSRGQMASFLAYTRESFDSQPVDAAGDFYDDDEGNTHEFTINGVTTIGLAQGTGPRRYSPETTVDRETMAVFLARLLGDLEAKGMITPLRGRSG